MVRDAEKICRRAKEPMTKLRRNMKKTSFGNEYKTFVLLIAIGLSVVVADWGIDVLIFHEEPFSMFETIYRSVLTAVFVVYGIIVTGLLVQRKKTEETLRISEEKFRKLFIDNPEPAVCLDQNLHISDVNPRFIALFGYSLNEIKGKSINDVTVPVEKMEEAEMLDGKVTHEVVYHDSVRKNKYGSLIPVSISASPLIINDQPFGYVAVYKDITERKRMEDALKESEEKLRSLVESSSDQIFMLDRDYRFLLANKTGAGLFGISSQEMVGKSISEVFPKAIVAQFSKNIKNVLDTGLSMLMDEKMVVEGRELYSSTSLNPVIDESGRVTAVTGIVRDITERKKTEQELTIKESAIASSADGMALADLQGNLTYVNPAFAKMWGYDSDKEIVGKTIMEIAQRGQSREKADEIVKVLRKRGVWAGETAATRKDGSKFYVSLSASMVKDKTGEPICMLSSFVDITERKKSQEEQSRLLHDLDKRLRELNCVYGISKIFEKSDVSLDEALRGVTDLLPPALQYPDVACARVIVENREFSTRNFKETRWKLQTDIRVHGKKAGFVEICYLEERPTIAEGSFLEEEGDLVDAVAERLGKVTEREQSEQVMRASLERYRSFVEVTGELGWITNFEGELVEDSPSFRKFTGQTYEEIKGQGWSKAIHPDDLERATQTWKKSTQTKSKYETEYRLRRYDGIYRYFMARGIPLFEEDGNIREWVGTCIDITGLKDVEEHLKETNRKLEATNEKLHVVGSLTRHDVNNKLSAVTGNAYLLRRKLAENPKALEQLNDMETAVRLVGKIFDFARIYEKLGTEQLASVDVDEAVGGAVSLVSDLKGIKIVNECNGLSVLADSLLRQLFYNLIDNTLKYGEKTGQIRIYSRTPSVDRLELVYEDDGVGIPDSIRSNLFKEGFTSGKGTGYGLFTIKRICEVYGWTIEEKGEQGKGVQFIMTIPAISSSGKANLQNSEKLKG